MLSATGSFRDVLQQVTRVDVAMDKLELHTLRGRIPPDMRQDKRRDSDMGTEPTDLSLTR